jgi:hypothetical protein
MGSPALAAAGDLGRGDGRDEGPGVDVAASVRAAELPAIHADPVDRILIAAAQRRELTVITTA